MRAKFGMEGTIEKEVMLKRLRWLGHTCRIAESRMPKRIIFGRLLAKRPFYGVKLCWKNKIHRDLKKLNMQTDWYETAQDKEAWHNNCTANLSQRRTTDY